MGEAAAAVEEAGEHAILLVKERLAEGQRRLSQVLAFVMAAMVVTSVVVVLLVLSTTYEGQRQGQDNDDTSRQMHEEQ